MPGTKDPERTNLAPMVDIPPERREKIVNWLIKNTDLTKEELDAIQSANSSSSNSKWMDELLTAYDNGDVNGIDHIKNRIRANINLQNTTNSYSPEQYELMGKINDFNNARRNRKFGSIYEDDYNRLGRELSSVDLSVLPKSFAENYEDDIEAISSFRKPETTQATVKRSAERSTINQPQQPIRTQENYKPNISNLNADVAPKQPRAKGTNIAIPKVEHNQIIPPQPRIYEQENYAPNIIEQQSNSPQIMMSEQENYKPDIPEQPSAYDRLIEAYESRKRKDDAKERKYKAREAITGIGDAARSISNLYFTTQDAPNAFDANNSVSEKARQRTALAKAKHDKDRAEWMSYMLNVVGRKEAAKQAADKTKLAQQKFEAEEKRKNALNEARIELVKAQGANNEARTAYWNTKIDLLEKGYDLDVAESAALVAERNARANKINADRQGKTEKTTTTDEMGKTKTVVKTTTPNATSNTSEKESKSPKNWNGKQDKKPNNW